MREPRSSTRPLCGVLLLGGVAFVACDATPTGPSEGLGQTQSAVFANGGFETGAAGQAPPSWTIQPYLDSNGVTVASHETRSDLNLQAGGTAATVLLSTAAGPESQPDANLGAAGTLRWPRYGNQCALVNQNGKNKNVNSMTQTMTVGSGDVDPMDGKIHVRFVVAPVLENPGHPADEQPYYFVQLTNVTQSTIVYSDFNLSNQAGVPWQSVMANGTTYLYTDWILNDISPGGTAIATGDMIELEVVASGCSLGAHMGNVYVDGGNGANLPEVFVVGHAPAQGSAGSTLTYTLDYENGATTAAAGAIVTFNTPPGTTFASVNAPGLTCTTPTAGMAGVVTCTIGAIAAGAGGSFQIVVTVAPGTVGDVVEELLGASDGRDAAARPEDHHQHRLHRRLAVLDRSMVRRERGHVHRDARERHERTERSRTHGPDVERHLHGGGGDVDLHERGLRYARQSVWIGERRRTVHERERWHRVSVGLVRSGRHMHLGDVHHVPE